MRESDRLRAEIKTDMATRAAIPTRGTDAWMLRTKRELLLADIEAKWRLLDEALEREAEPGVSGLGPRENLPQPR